MFIDSISNKTILEDVSSRTYVRAYDKLLDRKTVKEKAQPEKPEQLFKDDIANKAAENIAFKPKVEIPTTERLKEMGSTVKKKAIIEAIDTKYPVLEALREAKVNTKTGIEKLNLYEQTRILEGMPNRAAYFIEFNTL